MDRHIVFLLEEASAKELIDRLFPRLFPPDQFNCSHRCIPFEGKQDLEKNIITKIRAYKVPNSRFVILRDQDSGDCFKIKKSLKELAARAGKKDALVRIACREIESWYLADLAAVEQGLSLQGLNKQQDNRKYRAPDYLESPSQELSKLTQKQYQKMSGSRKIAPHLDLTNRRSPSFYHFVEGLKRVVDAS